MKSFGEAVEYLDRIFGKDYSFEEGNKEVGGADLVVLIRRESDGANFGYLAGIVGCVPGGVPELEVRIYLEMGTCAPYFEGRG